MKRKRLLIVGWGTWVSERPFVLAKRKGLNIYLATGAQYPSWVKKYVPVSNIILTNPFNTDRLVIDVVQYLNRNHIHLDAIAAHFELNVVHAATLASILGLPGIPPPAARKSSANKLLMRYACKQHGIPTPRFYVAQTTQELFAALKYVGRPAIVKPVMFGHSYGVFRVEKDDIKEIIIKKFARATQQLNPAIYPLMADYHTFNGYFLVEEYLEGTVISVDGLVQDQRVMPCGMAEFTYTKDNSFTQEAAYIPARVSADTQTRCFQNATRIIRALGFDHCGFHCEMVLTPKGPMLLEVASRLPGGNMTIGYLKAYGVDMIDLYLDICFGKKVRYAFHCHKRCVYHRSIFTHCAGVVAGVAGFDTLGKKRHFRLFWHAPVGSTVSPVAGIPESLAYYQLNAPTQEKLSVCRKEAEETLRFTLSLRQSIVRRFTAYFRGMR